MKIRMNRQISLRPALLIALGLLTCSCINTSTELQFDSQRWKSGDVSVRRRMCPDILKNEILIGKRKNEVLDILGPADEDKITFLSYRLDDRNRFEKLVMVAVLNLVVIFNGPDDKVTSVKVVDR